MYNVIIAFSLVGLGIPHIKSEYSRPLISSWPSSVHPDPPRAELEHTVINL